MHLQTNCQSDLSEIWWMNSQWISPGLVNLWSYSTEFLRFHGLWLFEQFPCICRWTADLIELKFGGWTHYGTPQAWLTFGHALLNFLWLVELYPYICRQTTDQIELKFGSWAHYCIPKPNGHYQDWMTFGIFTLLNPSSDLPPLWLQPHLLVSQYIFISSIPW